MFKRLLTRLLPLLMVAFLGACSGGGAFSTSDSTTDSSSDGNASSDGATSDVSLVADINLYGQTLIPLNEPVFIDVQTVTDNGFPVSNAPLTIVAGGSISLGNVPSATDITGRASFSVSNKNAESANIIITSGSVSVSTVLHFGAVVSSAIDTAIRPANGQDAVTLTVRAMTADGFPISDLPVYLAFSPGSFATAANTAGVTDAGGSFITTITDTVVETLTVTPNVGGMSLSPIQLSFTVSTELQTPSKVDLTVANTNIPADGESFALLTVVARDASNTPLANVPVTLAINSGSAILGSASGTTGDNGAFITNIVNTVVEEVQVTPTAGGITGESKFVKFIAPDAGQLVSTVNIEISGTNTVQADGQQTITVALTARDVSGNPVVGADASIMVERGSATVSPDSGTTDASGRFIAVITDEFAESFRVRGNVNGVQSAYSTELTFTAVAGDVNTIPGSVQLIATPSAGAIANGDDTVSITAVVRDTNGTPMKEVEVSLSTHTVSTPDNAGTAIFEAGSGLTGDGGTFTTTMTNTVPGTLLVTATARGKSSSSNITFNPVPSQEPAQLVVSVVGNGQPANGQDEVILTAVARDASGAPVEGARVNIVFGQNGQGQPSAAVPDQASGLTDAGGRVEFKITDTMAETFSVTVGTLTGTATPQTVMLNFKANAASGTPPAKVTASVNRDTAQADGTDEILLTVIARDASNTPLSGIAISLGSNSGSALLAPASGETGENGALQVVITNTQAEVVSITPTATAGGVAGNPVTLTFTEVPSITPARVEVQVSGNGAPADGETAVTLTVLVTDAVGQPLSGKQVRLSSQPTTALFNPETGAAGETSANGTFITSMTSTTVGTVRVTPTADGISGQAVDINFTEPTSSRPETMQLLTSSTQLASEGKVEGVLITALLRTKGNNPFQGAEVIFSSDSGLIQALDDAGNPVAKAVTNSSGQAQARLTTIGNPINRSITVTAVSGELREQVQIEVVGTSITIDGPDSGTLGGTLSMTVSLKDSAGTGISNQELSLNLTGGNQIQSTSPAADGAGIYRTDASGKVEVIIAANVSGADQLRASAEGVTEVIHDFNVSGDNFVIEREGACLSNYGADGDVPLNTLCTYKVHWDDAGVPRAGEPIEVSATRGSVTLLQSPPIPAGSTDSNGDMRFEVIADNAGPTTITVAATAANGPSSQVKFDFIATSVASITLQANPATVGVNSGTSEAERSEIIAIVRDDKHNLVKNMRVEFTLSDITGGKISPSSANTDRYGQATTVYIAGGSPSASGDPQAGDGVLVTARIPGLTPVTCDPTNSAANALCPQVRLTVAKRGVYITLGTGKTVTLPDETRYAKPYSVLLNDINGVAVANAEIDLSVIPLTYNEAAGNTPDLGFDQGRVVNGYRWLTDEDGGFIIWGAVVADTCSNEDVNRNGVLDPGEDLNSNGKLEPGNIAALPDKVVTDENGFATFDIVYARTYADWVTVELTARAVVAGTEDTAKSIFTLPGALSDYDVSKSPPPAAPDWVCP